MKISPFRGLRYDLGQLSVPAEAVCAPPYDVISPDEHRRLLDGCSHNITWLTLGSEPGGVSDYGERKARLDQWVASGAMVEADEPAFYVYEIDYSVPGDSGIRRRFRGLVALGEIRPFADGAVLPHEQTFPKVVDDRLRLLASVDTHLESILLLYADRERAIDAILDAHIERGEPAIRVEAHPGEFHTLFPIRSPDDTVRLRKLFQNQRPIIADGHHRYTTGLRFAREQSSRAGCGWQLMTFANLYSDGLSILATHRLVKLRGLGVSGALQTLTDRMARVEAGGDWDVECVTADERLALRFPEAARNAKTGADASPYGLLHNVIFKDWLADALNEASVQYYKEGTGEMDALKSGAGDILFRMPPVGREEFQRVVEGGDLFPHKTTYFYPKLWSGLILWRHREVLS